MIGTSRTYIAIVDDDEGFCLSLARMLRLSGYDPVTYDSAESFLSEKDQPRFGCLLLDIKLGGISGLELGHRLTAVGCVTPIIYLTAYDSPRTREAARAAGCTAVVSKLEPREVLLTTIADALNPNRRMGETT